MFTKTLQKKEEEEEEEEEEEIGTTKFWNGN